MQGDSPAPPTLYIFFAQGGSSFDFSPAFASGPLVHPAARPGGPGPPGRLAAWSYRPCFPCLV